MVSMTAVAQKAVLFLWHSDKVLFPAECCKDSKRRVTGDCGCKRDTGEEKGKGKEETETLHSFFSYC